MLVSKEVKTENVVLSRFQGVTKTWKWYFYESNQLITAWTNAIPNFENVGKTVKIVNNRGRH